MRSALTESAFGGIVLLQFGKIRVVGGASPTITRRSKAAAIRAAFPMSERCGSPSGLPVPCGRSCTPASLGHHCARRCPGSIEHKETAQ